MSEAAARSYRRSDLAEESMVGERAVLYHRDSGKAIVLNPTGSRLWKLLAAPQTTQALAGQLQSQFPSLSPQQAEHDVAAFVQELLTHELILVEKEEQ